MIITLNFRLLAGLTSFMAILWLAHFSWIGPAGILASNCMSETLGWNIWNVRMECYYLVFRNPSGQDGYWDRNIANGNDDSNKDAEFAYPRFSRICTQPQRL